MTTSWTADARARASTTLDGSGSDHFNRSQLSRRQAFAHNRYAAAAEHVDVPGMLRVLVVDDNRDSADALSALVQCLGYSVQSAYTGPDALRVAAVHHPHVVLLDIAMPYMDGCQVARQLRSDFRKHECFLIAITGCTDTGLRLQCQEADIDLVLVKPVDPSVLETLLLLEFELLQTTAIRHRLAGSATMGDGSK